MADRLHLQPKHRQVLEALLRKHLPDVEVWAYGSRVSGKSHDGSDLDLVLRGPGLNEIPIGQLGDFEEAVRESTIPFLVEARDWSRLPTRFHREIERDHVILQEGKDRGSLDLEWPLVTVEGISEKVAIGPFGSSIKVSTFVPYGIPIINGQHLNGSRVDDSPGFSYITEDHAQRLANARVYRGDIVFTHRGNIGQVSYIPDDSLFDQYIVSQSQFYVRCDRSKVIPEFLTAYFRSADGQHKLLANASQVGVPSIAQPTTYIRSIEIPLPPMLNQRAIAHVLGTLDDKIELNRHMNETLEAMARALFKSWFVDFDPVRAKMEGRDSYFDSAIWDVFPDTLDEEGKPKGWQGTELGDRVEILDAKRIPLSSRERQKRQGPFPYHGAAGVLDHIDDYLFDGVHVLLGEDGSVIRADGTPFTQYVWGKFWVNNHAHVLKGKSISDEMLLCFLEQIDIAPFVTGAVQPKLNQKNLKSVPFPPADPRMAACFQRATEPLFTQLRINVEQSQSLTVLRDTLLPKLISGDVRLREAEMAVEAVA